MSATPVKRLVLEVTRECHFRCLHCSVRGGEPVPETEISYEVLQGAIDDFESLGGLEVVFTGGEPLERKELLLRLVSYAKSKGLRTIMYSVGYTLTESNVRNLAEAGLDEVYLSLEGGKEVHESITRVPGSYAIVLRALAMLQKSGVKVSFHFTAMQINYREITHVSQVAEENGVSIVKILDFVPQGRGFDNEFALALSWHQRQEFINIVKTIARTNIVFDFGGNPLNLIDSQFSCHASEKLVLTNTGIVIPCSSLRSTKGTHRPAQESVLGDITLSPLHRIIEHSRMTIDSRNTGSCRGPLNAGSRSQDRSFVGTAVQKSEVDSEDDKIVNRTIS